MNMLEQYIIKNIIRKQAKQGNHKQRITNLYGIIRKVCQTEFTEDNEPTLNAFLQECFDNACKN